MNLALAVPVPMADGTSLSADIIRPPGASALPCLLTVTPYTADFGWVRAGRYAEAGFAVAIISCRGRGNSGGVFDLYNDGSDGAAAVAWAASQTWCDGQVGLFGGSYAGLNQWQIAACRPPALTAMAPAMAPMPGYDADFYAGIFPAGNARWASLVRGRTLQRTLFADDAFWRASYLDHYRAGAGPEALTRLCGAPDPLVACMLAQMNDATFWASRVPDAAGFKAVDVPVLSVTGTADNAQRGALEYRSRHLAANPAAQHWLLVGPWAHAGPRDPVAPADAPETPDRAEVDTAEDATILGFFKWAMKGAPLPALLSSPAMVYVAGEERWRPWRDLPPTVMMTAALPGNRLEQAASDHRLADAADAAGVADFTALMGGECADDAWYRHDRTTQSATAGLAPLGADVRLIGRPQVTLKIDAEGLPFDIACLLWAELPNGDNLLLSSDMRRLREPGLVRLDGFRLVARRLPAGTRLSVQLRILDTPDFQRAPALCQPGGFVRLVPEWPTLAVMLPLASDLEQAEDHV